MRKLIGVGVAVLVSFVLVAGCGKAKTETGQVTCPVMAGNPVNPKIFTEYEGQKIYFCCEKCKADFAKSPKKYVKIVNAELKKIAADKAAAEKAAATKAAPAAPKATKAPAKKK
jgi:YHS domain-containing protein